MVCYSSALLRSVMRAYADLAGRNAGCWFSQVLDACRQAGLDAVVACIRRKDQAVVSDAVDLHVRHFNTMVDGMVLALLLILRCNTGSGLHIAHGLMTPVVWAWLHT